MEGVADFFYRIPGIHEGIRPGAHRSRSPGAGQEFTGHHRLFDAPDVRRLDLKASLQDLRGDWLVRAPRQRSALRLQAIVDVSPSMAFAWPGGDKRNLCASIVAAIGASASRHGDRVGLTCFDDDLRSDLVLPPTASRGVGLLMAEMIRALPPPRPAPGPARRWWQRHVDRRGRGRPSAASTGPAGQAGQPTSAASATSASSASSATSAGLEACLELSHEADLVFILSDFHGPLDAIRRALAEVEHALVVPIVVWSTVELEPPPGTGLVSLVDLETGEPRQLWLDEALRTAWREAVADRRRALAAALGGGGAAPFFVVDQFDPERMSRYFMEEIA